MLAAFLTVLTLALGAFLATFLTGSGATSSATGAGVGAGVLSSKLIESIARQPELEDQLRPTYFLGIGLVDAVPMISVGLAFYVLFVA